jgi:hypothetical protein
MKNMPLPGRYGAEIELRSRNEKAAPANQGG